VRCHSWLRCGPQGDSLTPARAPQPRAAQETAPRCGVVSASGMRSTTRDRPEAQAAKHKPAAAPRKHRRFRLRPDSGSPPGDRHRDNPAPPPPPQPHHPPHPEPTTPTAPPPPLLEEGPPEANFKALNSPRKHHATSRRTPHHRPGARVTTPVREGRCVAQRAPDRQEGEQRKSGKRKVGAAKGRCPPKIELTIGGQCRGAPFAARASWTGSKRSGSRSLSAARHHAGCRYAPRRYTAHAG
jgi:hypothetical protein